ncbi:GNAT family N-acetyltransferase [Bacillaceae bacterium W0354]
MHTTWATKEDINKLTELWYAMTTEMEEVEGIPRPSLEKVKEVNELFNREYNQGNLMFRIVKDNAGTIITCSGGLLRSEYAYPLAEEQSIFGWVINVYTIKEYRRQRLASKLTNEVCNWLKTKGANRAKLWTSSQAREMYRNLGFTESFEMDKKL